MNLNKYPFDISLSSERLVLDRLDGEDNYFIFELVNSDGWLTYIGDRDVKSAEGASAYINKINENKHVAYWVVKLRDTGERIGVVTLMKKDYLPYPDLGYAFLANHTGQGYAQEACESVLEVISEHAQLKELSASTSPENDKSIRLLRKLGFELTESITVEGDMVKIYRKQVRK